MQLVQIDDLGCSPRTTATSTDVLFNLDDLNRDSTSPSSNACVNKVKANGMYMVAIPTSEYKLYTV